jgi:hypothetical protein
VDRSARARFAPWPGAAALTGELVRRTGEQAALTIEAAELQATTGFSSPTPPSRPS